MSSYFFLGAKQNNKNVELIAKIKEFSESHQEMIYILDRPLTDSKYSYDYKNALILLSSGLKITIINCDEDCKDDYHEYIEDIIEDLSSISDKYHYKEIIGRSRHWRNDLFQTDMLLSEINDIDSFLKDIKLSNQKQVKQTDLLISLFIGSINDINIVKSEVPETILDKVKQKIQLFDSDQTRFIYKSLDKSRIRIQGLSGTGKTELLLHKLKDIYINEPDSKIIFTCHNKILANNLKKRIPQFFNFMKVEQQIEWDSRLWCVNAWGSRAHINSGAYRKICAFYEIPFHSFSYQMTFDKVCKIAIEDIREKYKGTSIPKAFHYMFIDESQDFEDSFFDLCDLATEKRMYIAGDIFQSIFDDNIMDSIEPDFLLGKCYRTDPKTLMFAHALGMGLFEEHKLRWLEEKEWKDCGYNVDINDSTYYLSREPLKRFEDLDDNFESIRIVEATSSFSESILDIIQEIKTENVTVNPADIGIIFLDNSKSTYRDADTLEVLIQQRFQWEVSKAYESKEKEDNKILISNRNNVKGLEFPFVICVTRRITNSHSYRNSLYTMLTRSFIKSYFVTQVGEKSGLTEKMKHGLQYIIDNKQMRVEEPTSAEKEQIRTSFKYNRQRKSHYDLMVEVFNELSVSKEYHQQLMNMTENLNMMESEKDILIDFVTDNLKYIER